jgi:hypothetical protein
MNIIDSLKRTTFIVCINTGSDEKEFQVFGNRYKKYLFEENQNFRSYSSPGTIIHYNESNHILNDTFLRNDDRLFLFLSGDFIQDVDKEKLMRVSNESEFKQLVLTLNGSFNAVFYDKPSRNVVLYNDIIGLKKFYYGFKNNHLLISSLLVPFYDEKTEYNKDFINDFIFVRIGLTYESQFKNVYTIGPDFFVSLDLVNKKRSEHAHIREHQKVSFKSDTEVMEKYFTMFQNLNRRVMDKSNGRKFYTTLTGGADTRINFNMLLHSGQKITSAITNFAYSSDDKEIAQQICADYGIDLKDSSQFPKFPQNISDTISYLTNGMLDVITEVNNFIEDSVIYYGSFGNFLSRRQYGNHRYIMSSGSLEQFIDRYFTFIFSDYDMIKKLLPSGDLNAMKSRFASTFDVYFKNLENKEMYYYFYKNFRNFYNDCRFATGSFTGSSGIFPFNNLDLINLYNEFSFKDTFSHKYHFMASYYKNPKLSQYKIGHFPLSVKYKPLFIYYFSEPIANWDARRQRRNYKNWSKEELNKYFNTNVDYSKYSHIYDLDATIELLAKTSSSHNMVNGVQWVTEMFFSFDDLCKRKFNEVKNE